MGIEHVPFNLYFNSLAAKKVICPKMAELDEERKYMNIILATER